ncbi:MAG: PTS sugar transporter subunit IIC [Firmicutes bacterium]|nr:PTS sugar transporter subunit IIC [Bacillota bacterium]
MEEKQINQEINNEQEIAIVSESAGGANEPTVKSENKHIKKIKALSKRWFIDAFSGMALGLFATLIAGTIVEQIGKLFGDGNAFGAFLIQLGTLAKTLMGAGIGAGVAFKLCPNKPLVIFSCLVAGTLGAYGQWIWGQPFGSISMIPPMFGRPGSPIGAYLASLIACEIVCLYAGKTKVDIILIPIGAIVVSAVVILTLCYPVNWFIDQIAKGMVSAVNWNAVIMGIVIAVVMGLILTLPPSSAALWITIASAPSVAGTDAILLAGGAAVVGCASHMIGFAVASFRENKWGGLVAQGLGTSMLQIPNLMKNPKILLPQIASSMVVGPLATSVFKIRCNITGGGMGTSGLVGVFGTIDASWDIPVHMLVLGVIFLFFIIPAVVSFGVSELLRKIGWIKFGDQKINT